MPRVKRGVTARARHKKVLALAKGFRGRRNERLPHRQGSGDEGGAVCLPRPPREEARVPRALDRPHQRGRARARHDLQRVHDRPEEGVDRHRPQGAGRHGRARQGGVCARSRSRPKPLWPDAQAARPRGRRNAASLFLRQRAVAKRGIAPRATSIDSHERTRPASSPPPCAEFAAVHRRRAALENSQGALSSARRAR